MTQRSAISARNSIVPSVKHGDTELAQLDVGMESGEPVRELQRM